MQDQTYYATPDGIRYRITIESDPEPMSPRDADNLTLFVVNSRAMISPDSGYVRDSEFPDIPEEYLTANGVDMRRIRKYVALYCPDVLAIAGVDVYDNWSPTLSLSDDDDTDGYVVITRTTWNNLMGRDIVPTPDELISYIREDIDAYNRWANGEYVQYAVEQLVTWTRADTGASMTDWEVTESCGSIDDAEYALGEAIASLPDDARLVTDDDSHPDDIDTLDCVRIGNHHSDDRFTVYHGSVTPLRVCGFHQSQANFINRILTEGK